MAKLTLSNIVSFFANTTAASTYAANNDAIEAAIENTLSRDGTTPNTMSANLDMNSNRILNHPEPDAVTDLATKNYVDNALILESTPTASVSTYIRTLLDDIDAATARATLGATTVGDAVFIATTAAVARTALGSTAVGDDVFVAASASAARTAIGFGASGAFIVAGDIATDAVTAEKIDGTTLKNKNLITFTADVPDISSMSSHWVVCPLAGTIVAIYSVIDTAITIDDAVLSFQIASVPVTDGDITITQLSSAPGDVDSSAPTAANVVTAGQAIEILTDGGSTTASRARLTFVVDVS